MKNIQGIIEETFARVRKVVTERLDVEDSVVTIDAHLTGDLGADELDPVEVMMGIEEEFEIEIPDEDAQWMFRVRDFVLYILERLYGINLEKVKVLKLSNFIVNQGLSQENALEIIDNKFVTSYWNKICKLNKALHKPGTSTAEMVEFAVIFRDDFTIANLENINKLIEFLDDFYKPFEFTREEVVELIRSGKITDYFNTIKYLNDTITQKEADVQKRKAELQVFLSEMEVVKKQKNIEIQTLINEATTLKNQLNSYLQNGD